MYLYGDENDSFSADSISIRPADSSITINESESEDEKESSENIESENIEDVSKIEGTEEEINITHSNPNSNSTGNPWGKIILIGLVIVLVVGGGSALFYYFFLARKEERIKPFKFENEEAFSFQAYKQIEKLTRETSFKVAKEIKKLSGPNFANFLFVETKHPVNENIDIIGFSLQNETEEYNVDRCQQIDNVLLILDSKSFFSLGTSLYQQRELYFRATAEAEIREAAKVIVIKRKKDNSLFAEIPAEVETRFNELRDKISEKGAITGKIIGLKNIDNEKIDFEWQEDTKSYRVLNIDIKNTDFTIEVKEIAEKSIRFFRSFGVIVNNNCSNLIIGEEEVGRKVNEDKINLKDFVENDSLVDGFKLSDFIFLEIEKPLVMTQREEKKREFDNFFRPNFRLLRFTYEDTFDCQFFSDVFLVKGKKEASFVDV
ncbi:17634_t:CDS:2 [Gigaspora margarita]|uniref:17634_t:CDS:1 n=1 Tax=Gigaspora margarita TaxID=4874 RepID=A0ABN7U4S6_GIGMA|nr:17634_t:CDS:2 [Gigaspora margarita]